MDDTADSETLFATGVLTVQGEAVTTTADFESTVEEYVEEMAALSFEEVGEHVRERVEREAVVGPLAELGDDDPRFLAELCALHDRLDPSTDDDWLSLLPVLRLFRPTEMPTDGVPESFIPVSGPELPQLTSVYSPAVVYVWLDDCPPCDTMKEDLESIFRDSRAVMPFAVYGPKDREFLRAEYDVTAGPALLFVRDGGIDSRLYGAQPQQTVESELSKLQEYSSV